MFVWLLLFSAGNGANNDWPCGNYDATKLKSQTNNKSDGTTKKMLL